MDESIIRPVAVLENRRAEKFPPGFTTRVLFPGGELFGQRVSRVVFNYNIPRKGISTLVVAPETEQTSP